MAIDKYIYVCLRELLFERAVICKYMQMETVKEASELKHNRAREALLMHRVLHGVEINSIAELPAQSGLGSSGSYLVALLTALRYLKRESTSPTEIAEEACKIEIDLLKEPVGKQDQYISAHGGMCVLDISTHGEVKVTPVKLSQSQFREFLTTIHVYHTGVYRNASDILSEQNQLPASVENSLLRIKELGWEFLESLETTDFERFGHLLHTHWEVKKKMSTKIKLPGIEAIYHETRDRFGVLGGKLIGAGGGGFLMLSCVDRDKSDLLETFMRNRGFPRLHFSVDPRGVRIVTDFAERML